MDTIEPRKQMSWKDAAQFFASWMVLVIVVGISAGISFAVLDRGQHVQAVRNRLQGEQHIAQQTGARLTGFVAGSVYDKAPIAEVPETETPQTYTLVADTPKVLASYIMQDGELDFGSITHGRPLTQTDHHISYDQNLHAMMWNRAQELYPKLVIAGGAVSFTKSETTEILVDENEDNTVHVWIHVAPADLP